MPGEEQKGESSYHYRPEHQTVCTGIHYSVFASDQRKLPFDGLIQQEWSDQQAGIFSHELPTFQQFTLMIIPERSSF